MSHAARLFKTIVVAGASLALPNCGGESSRNVSKGASGAGGAGVGGAAGSGGVTIGATGGTAGLVDGETGLTPADCADPADFVCGSYKPELDCRCDPTLPHVATDCEFTSQFHCECHDGLTYACLPGSSYQGLRATVCRCDPMAPRSPYDCGETVEFECAEYSPVLQGCLCNPNAPMDEDDCPGPSYFQCFHSDPAYGCECIATIR
jgi:hypothetical protein